ncbi:hypothetical protein I7I51_02319 [Histoplasma capsulatum]|uniref:Uncharacterized protein n=1 Tax=Ajellomyces capsulatus TaxID=5037 RepID=A0A8A1M9D7_AJECA|nr:conserved hypothetical protein [Histoplasma mississippiense (nom. inval.)]EDN04599.1 conserved hypothetical protein [Histoplasma mississippiense (nom. inval.)]QSS62581.1 hypothetical protein I7I51_02319 [Histoplasma capsulatum]
MASSLVFFSRRQQEGTRGGTSMLGFQGALVYEEGLQPNSITRRREETEACELAGLILEGSVHLRLRNQALCRLEDVEWNGEREALELCLGVGMWGYRGAKYFRTLIRRRSTVGQVPLHISAYCTEYSVCFLDILLSILRTVKQKACSRNPFHSFQYPSNISPQIPMTLRLALPSSAATLQREPMGHATIHVQAQFAGASWPKISNTPATEQRQSRN